jgi:zinc/manganese transport system substrate-binding protein/manganese/iron transport system substrate-binding protein
MTKRLVWFGLIIALSATACSSGGSPSAKLRIVATTTIVGDIVRAVAGDKADVTVLLAPGVDPHEYQPVPSDVQALAQAKIVFANGAGLEPWLPDLIESAGTTARSLSDGLSLRTVEEDGVTEDDPHVWFDVANAIHFAGQIRDALIAVDAANADVYRANADAYIGQLKELDAWIVAQVGTLPPQNRLLVTNHDTFGYFAARYGFTVLGTVFPAAGAAASPSAQQVSELIQSIQRAGVRAVFTENTLNPDLANTIAQEAGVKVISELYTDALGPADSPAATYIDLMRFDVQTIVEALK